MNKIVKDKNEFLREEGNNKSKMQVQMDMLKPVLKNNQSWMRWPILFLAILLSFLLIFGWAVELIYVPKVAYGLKFGNTELGGMSQGELNRYFAGKEKNILDGVGMTLGGEKVEQKTFGEMGLWIDTKGCRDQIWAVGRQRNILASYYNRIYALVGGKRVICKLEFDKVDYNNFVSYLRDKYDEPAVSANVEKNDGELVVNGDKDGVIINNEILQADLYNNLSALNFVDIKLSKITEKPQITEVAAIKVKELAQKEIDNGMTWKYEDNEINVHSDDIYEMLYFEQKSTDSGLKNEIYVGYDLATVDRFLNNNAWMYEDKPVNPKLQMTEKGPIVVEEGSEGKMVNRTKLIADLDGKIGEEKSEIKLPVEVMKSMIDVDNIDKLGIKELIAVGSSDFSYSPVNRIHNITVGAERYNGTVIAPGEEFSFTTRLGSVDAASGYLPELVIADDETRPEYGGGLCQVSTTMYRAALNAGFPITDRSPHQYRVSYYEPAGQDATIYVPNPDLKFINDTKNYVMIEAVIDGSILTFNFYGTKDGREVTVTEPEIYNITSPPSPIYIYTSSLAPGEKWQVDTAHYGADATFYRYIKYSNGEKKEEEFFSRYQAWSAKFKVGEGEVKPVEEKKTEETKNTDGTVVPTESTVIEPSVPPVTNSDTPPVVVNTEVPLVSGLVGE
jgi:vancomycin resistance protein YoaR